MSTLKIKTIANKLNKLASSHPIGELQVIRTKLKELTRRSGSKIFSKATKFKDWAFHHGGRTELQFNIGYADGETDDLRHGVAFSFELSQTLKSIDILIPKVKCFNDFILTNAEDFGDMRMWHYAAGERSPDSMPGPISPTLVSEGVFVFLGNRQPSKKINYEKILDDFDRLLPLFEYVESKGAKPITVSSESEFVFKSGCSTKVSSAKATLAKKELDLDLRHNELQQGLYEKLVKKYGRDNVGTERPSGVGTKVDVVVRKGKEFWFYEIKTALTARACLREALGQLLEYSFWPGAQEPTRLIIVGESALDTDGKEYLSRLKKRFSLPIEYEQIAI